MGSIRLRPNGGLFFDFRYRAIRCREQTTLNDSPANRRKMEQVLKKIESEISQGTFEYARYFPTSKLAARFARVPDALPVGVTPAGKSNTPLFSQFVKTWQDQKKVEWRRSYTSAVASILDTHLLPFFGPTPVGDIDRTMVLEFRSALASIREHENGTGIARAPATVNRIMGILRQILDECVARYGGTNPCQGIKQLKLKRVDIHPFSIEQVREIIDTIRPDYKNYMTVRFFTGMRSGEAHGLRWKHIDFNRRQILIRETYYNGQVEYTKTDGSQREIDMSAPVFDALTAHKPEALDPEAYVFCTRNCQPIDNKNFNNRIWKPLLRYMDLKQRRPYQMRHTCATLWLGSGENPQWIAKQLGHTTTEMLFRVYSRYVPNLTRRDGSAFDRMVSAALNGGITTDTETTHV